MTPLIGLALLLLLVIVGLYLFVNTPPSTLVRAMRTFTTTFAALAGTGLLLTGRFGLAMVTGAAAFMALRALRGSSNGGGFASGGFGGAAGSGPSGKTSDITTDMLSMQLDHRTGDLDGEVLQGQYAGRALGSLGITDLLSLLMTCQRDDPRAVPLLETYLDRHHPDWRDDMAADQGAADRDAPPSADGMDRETACRILEVPPDASTEEIKAAHKRLMNKMHPDHGGSSYLAAQLNRAKDVLLGG